MAAAGNKKKFGLILASARREQAARSVAGVGGVRRLNPLRDSDDELEAGEGEEEEDGRQQEEEEDTMDWVQAALKKSGGGNSAQLAQQQRLMREALEEDASVFQYDELYDDMQAGRDTAKKEKKQQEKKPKFIHNILKSAERRKLEKEQRTERKVQREREEEKGLYDDKESFVTPAYLAKLEELKQAEARERMEALVEEKNDVAKHKNMGLFYQHLYKQRMGETSSPAVVKTEPPEEEAQQSEDAPNVRDTNPTPNANTDNGNNSAPLNDDITIRRRDQRSKTNKYRAQRDIDDSPTREESPPPHSSRKRQKLGRQDSDDSSDSEPERRKGADGRRSPPQSDSPDRGSKSLVKNKSNAKLSTSNDSSRSPSNSKSTSSKKKERETKIKDEPESSSDEVDNSKDAKKIKEEPKDSEKKPVESKESRDERIKKLFTKRCVGENFIEAQQRYFQRRAERESSGAKGL